MELFHSHIGQPDRAPTHRQPLPVPLLLLQAPFSPSPLRPEPSSSRADKLVGGFHTSGADAEAGDARRTSGRPESVEESVYQVL